MGVLEKESKLVTDLLC